MALATLNYSDPGEHPQDTARIIRDVGDYGLAYGRELVEEIRAKDPELGNKYLLRLLENLSAQLQTIFIGGPKPKHIPLGVPYPEMFPEYSPEWERLKRRRGEWDSDSRLPDLSTPPYVLNHLANSNEATNQSADGDEEGPLDRIGKLADKISEQWNDPRIPSADRYKDEMPPPIEKDAEPSTPREPLEKYDPPQPGRVPEAVWPEGMPPMVSPVPNPRIREQDDYGNGGFGMPRDNGTRSHKGVDIIAEAGEKVTSPVSGKVVAVYDPYQNMKDKNGNPSQHKDKFKAIDIVTEDGKTVQILYVNVDKDKFPNGTVVKAGETELGAAQDLSVAYPTKKHHQNGGMTNHIHLAVIDKNGDRIDPSGAIGVWNSE